MNNAAAGSRSRKVARRSHNQKGLAYLFFLIVLVVVYLGPIFLLILASLRPNNEYATYPVQLFPERIIFWNYLGMLRSREFLDALQRTFLLSITTAIVNTFSSALAGYAFARLSDVRGSRFLYGIVIAMMFVPYIVLLIPQFIIYARLHLVNTFWPWYLVALGGTPLYIFMYRQFFSNFPTELEEAAEIDGCSHFMTFLYIIIPNSKPVISVVLIYAFNAVWSDYIMPTLLLNNPEKLLGTWLAWPSRYMSYLSAATVLYALPVIILFLLVQKNIQKGILFTGFK